MSAGLTRPKAHESELKLAVGRNAEMDRLPEPFFRLFRHIFCVATTAHRQSELLKLLRDKIRGQCEVFAAHCDNGTLCSTRVAQAGGSTDACWRQRYLPELSLAVTYESSPR